MSTARAPRAPATCLNNAGFPNGRDIYFIYSRPLGKTGVILQREMALGFTSNPPRATPRLAAPLCASTRKITITFNEATRPMARTRCGAAYNPCRGLDVRRIRGSGFTLGLCPALNSEFGAAPHFDSGDVSDYNSGTTRFNLDLGPNVDSDFAFRFRDRSQFLFRQDLNEVGVNADIKSVFGLSYSEKVQFS
ncbi:hypothetical protein EVAR_6899_1 [Eumeta japonica]|uniref:Uncharacterized protein n=1 Tax=Eumeta variegata TaxID=151549 RepID=A0A4C1TGB3_EUMVA|nr:hypothetical protein EVAR_6899_1 [Eumeta japonica]